MQDEEYTPDERRLFDALPRESEPPRDMEDRLVTRLRHQGVFRRRWRPHAVLAAVAAAALVIGVIVGSEMTGRRSLESQLTRGRLTPDDARALLDRARAAYERAGERYAAIVGINSATAE